MGSCLEALLGHATAKGSAGLLSPTHIWGHISQKGLSELASGRDTTQGSTLPHCPPNLCSPLCLRLCKTIRTEIFCDKCLPHNAF